MRSSSSPPPPPPPAPPPPVERSDPIVLQNEERVKAQRKRGRAATMLTGPGGDTSPAMTASRVLGAQSAMGSTPILGK